MICIFTVKVTTALKPGVLYLDVRPGVRELRKDGRSIQLPLRQFKFMQALMANHPKPMTHWEMFYYVWGEGSHDRWGGPQYTDEDGGPLTPNNCIQQYAAKLRIKLAPMGLIVHAPRKGYGYEINEIEVKEAKAPADASGQEAPGGVPAAKAPRDPRGSKAGVPRKQALRAC